MTAHNDHDKQRPPTKQAATNGYNDHIPPSSQTTERCHITTATNSRHHPPDDEDMGDDEEAGDDEDTGNDGDSGDDELR